LTCHVSASSMRPVLMALVEAGRRLTVSRGTMATGLLTPHAPHPGQPLSRNSCAGSVACGGLAGTHSELDFPVSRRHWSSH
jgi:hypothetical protein